MNGKADKLISMQDAIDAFEEFRGWLPRDKAYGYVCKLKKLPSAPLYTEAELQIMQDLVEKIYEMRKVEVLQRTQMSLTKIIRCKDCKHWNTGNCNCPDIRVDCHDYYVGDIVTEEDFYCGFAKRRENE